MSGNLKDFQLKIKGLLKPQPSGESAFCFEEDPYFRELAGSGSLQMAREIALWWRAFQIEKYCVLSSAYLKKKGRFDEIIKTFYLHNDVSPFIEKTGMDLLAFLEQDKDQVLVSLSRFESALIKVKKGDRRTHIIEWHVHPNDILHYIIHHKKFKLKDIKGQFNTIVSKDIKGFFAVVTGDALREAGIG